jgi:hypothetical protein
MLLSLGVLTVRWSFARDSWQTGKIIEHPPVVRNLLADIPESQLFHSGEYICLPGDANHAPTCKKDWYVTEKESYTDVILADGTLFRVEHNSAASSVITRVAVEWSLAENDKAMKPLMTEACHEGICTHGKMGQTPTEGTFRYRLGKTGKDGAQEIEVEIPESCSNTIIEKQTKDGFCNLGKGWIRK